MPFDIADNIIPRYVILEISYPVVHLRFNLRDNAAIMDAQFDRSREKARLGIKER